MEGPRNVIADTFSRLLHSNMSSPLVEKKAASVVSSSESNNRNESSYSWLMDDKDIIVVCFFVFLAVCFFHKFQDWEWLPEVSHQRCVHYSKNPQDMASAREYINEALSIAMRAMKAAIHSTLGSSPGSLTFLGTCSLTFFWLLIGTRSLKDKNI